jgi:hypothetical protein
MVNKIDDEYVLFILNEVMLHAHKDEGKSFKAKQAAIHMGIGNVKWIVHHIYSAAGVMSIGCILFRLISQFDSEVDSMADQDKMYAIVGLIRRPRDYPIT